MLGDLINTTDYIEYGILIAIVLSAAELVCIATMNASKKLNPLAYVVALALCALLTFQMSRLIGACNVNNPVNEVQSFVGIFSQSAADWLGSVASISPEDIGWFIFRRCMWSILFMLVAGAVMYITMEKPVKRYKDAPYGAQIGRRYTSSSSRRRR